MGTRQHLQDRLADLIAAVPAWYAQFAGADAAAKIAAARAACTLGDADADAVSVTSPTGALLYAETIRYGQQGLAEVPISAELRFIAPGATAAARYAAADDLLDAIAAAISDADDRRTISLEVSAPLFELEAGDQTDGAATALITWTARGAA